MTDLNDIKSSIEGSSEWAANRQAIHIKRMTTAVHDLENNIINSLSQLKVNKGGSLASLRLNTKNLQTTHKDVILAFEKDFNGAAKIVTNDFKNVEANLVKSYMKLDEQVSFSGADKAMMDVLSNSAYQEYVAIGGQFQEKVVQSLYGNVIGGKGMSDLITDIQGVLGGSVSRTGRPLVNYARLYANDMIMNFQNDVNLKKGEQIGMKLFLYYGSVIVSTRDFCKRRVGQVYTKKQILSWKGGWTGKRGDAWTFRGGWNCRHHWQPVRKEWVEDFDPIEMQNYFTDSKLKMPKPVMPWGVEGKVKPISSPVEIIYTKNITEAQEAMSSFVVSDIQKTALKDYTGEQYNLINGFLRGKRKKYRIKQLKLYQPLKIFLKLLLRLKRQVIEE